jgi:hypothetical protein
VARSSEGFQTTDLVSAGPQPFEMDAVPASPLFAVWTNSRHEATVCQQLTSKGLQAFLRPVPVVFVGAIGRGVMVDVGAAEVRPY